MDNFSIIKMENLNEMQFFAVCKGNSNFLRLRLLCTLFSSRLNPFCGGLKSRTFFHTLYDGVLKSSVSLAVLAVFII